MNGLHRVSVLVLILAVVLLTLAFLNITKKVEETIQTAPQTALVVAQQQDAEGGGAESTSECIKDPTKCFNPSNNPKSQSSGGSQENPAK